MFALCSFSSLLLLVIFLIGLCITLELSFSASPTACQQSGWAVVGTYLLPHAMTLHNL